MSWICATTEELGYTSGPSTLFATMSKRVEKISRRRLSGAPQKRSLTFLVCALMGTLLTPPAHASGEAASFLQSAHSYEKQKNFPAAEVQLRNAARAEPANAAIHVELAQVYLELGNPNSAEAELLAAHLGGAKEEVLAPIMAQSLFESGDFGDLLKDVPAGSRPAKVESVVRTFRGLAQLALGETANAQGMLTDAERLDPKSASAKIALARFFLSQHKLDEALQRANQALALSSKNADALEIQGLVFMLRGDIDAAEQKFNAAIGIAPRNARALLDRANVEINKHQLDKARADVKAAQAASPGNGMALFLTARIDVENGKFREADALLNRINGLMTHLPEAYLLAAEVKLQLNQPGLAEGYLHKVLAQVPNEPKAYQMLGLIALRRGDAEHAVEMLEHAKQLEPKDVGTLGLLGQAYLSHGEMNKAQAVLGQAAVLAPKDQRVQTALAISQFATGDAQVAISKLSAIFKGGAGNIIAGPPLAYEALKFGHLDVAAATAEALVRRDPDNVVYGQLLAVVRVAQHKLPAAETILRTILAKHPDQAETRKNLAQIYFLTNRAAEGKKLFQNALQKKPDDAGIMQALADFDVQTRNYAEALNILSRAERLSPKDARLGLKIVVLFEIQKKWSDALDRARALQAKFANNPDVADAVGRVYHEAGNQAESIAAYQTAAAKFPNSPFVLAHYATGLTEAAKYPAALEVTTRAIALNPGDKTLKTNALYLTFLAQGPDAAVARAESFLPAAESAEPAGALMVIQAIAQAGRQTDAIVLAEKWQARAPSGELAATLASLYQRHGDSLKGLTLLENWVKSHNDDIDARFGLAQLYDALGKPDLAIAQYEWLAARNPDSSSILNNLALLYDQKQDARARATAQKASMLAPNSGPIADTFGWILIRQGDRAGGLKYLTRAGESTGGDPTVQYHLGVALYQNGDLNEARVVLDRVLKSNPPSGVGEQAKAVLAKIGVPKK